MARTKVEPTLFELQRAAYRASAFSAILNAGAAVWNAFAARSHLAQNHAGAAVAQSVVGTVSVCAAVWMAFNALSARNRMRATAVRALSDQPSVLGDLQ